MNLIIGEAPRVEPYQPGVYMLTGINGIGKSTVVEAITDRRPEALPLHASLELRGLFGNISRDELEHLSPEEKLSRMVIHFTRIFEVNVNDDRAVIMDTHLLVPVRRDDGVNYEDIWSPEYQQYVSAMVMLSASPESVKQWRLEDEQATGRRRNTDVETILVDQEKNITRFLDLRATGEIPAHSSVIENQNGRLAETQAAIESVFQQS